MMSTYPISWRGLLRRTALVASLAALTALAACGGGGGNAGTPLLGGGGGTPTDPNSVEASDLSVVLSSPSLPNTGQDKVTATITAVDTNRRALANIPITVNVDNGAQYTLPADKTDESGEVKAQIGTGSDRSNRVITVTVTSGTITRVATFQITGAKMTARLTPAVLSPGQTGKIEFVLVDTNSNAMIESPIVVQGVGGIEVTGETGNFGQFVYDYVAPAAAGTYVVTANAGGVTTEQSVLVVSSESGAVPDATLTVKSATVSANPNVVAANTEGTDNRAEVRALFVSTNNAPVANVRVRFDLGGDVNSIGGTFASGSGYVYSTSTGLAMTSYSPAERESPTGGVTVRACWDYRDFPAGTCPNQALTTLTVKSQPLSVSIRTSNQMISDESNLAYQKDFLVQVNDASGQAKANVVITPVVDIQKYFKGSLRWAEPFFNAETGKTESVLIWNLPRSGYAATCENEDINRNGVMEGGFPSGNEDANGSGQLDPYKADVVVSFLAGNVTDAKGQLVLRLTYAKSLAQWAAFKLTASASVLGSEGKGEYPSYPGPAILPVLLDDITDPLRFPHNVNSPYGVQSSPTVVVTNPEGKSAVLCTNPY